MLYHKMLARNQPTHFTIIARVVRSNQHASRGGIFQEWSWYKRHENITQKCHHNISDVLVLETKYMLKLPSNQSFTKKKKPEWNRTILPT